MARRHIADLPFLLWVDFETTGDDPYNDYLLDGGWVLTTGTKDGLEVVGTYSSLIGTNSDSMTERVLERLEVRLPVLKMHQKSGLLDTWVEGERVPAEQVQDDILDMLSMHGVGPDDFTIAGSGVERLDRPFIKVHMPALERELERGRHYACYDISSIRSFMESLGIRVESKQGAAKAHRGLDDILDHIHEARGQLAVGMGA